MKKFSLCKQLLIAGSVLIVASACQCQKKPDMEQTTPCEQEYNNQSDDDENCSSTNQSGEATPVAEESSSAANGAEPAESLEPIADTTTPASTPALSASVSEEKIEQSMVEAPKLEAVSAVSEHRAESSESVDQE